MEDEKKYRVLNRAPKPGDLIRLTDEAAYSFNRPGDILPVHAVTVNHGVAVCGRHHPRHTGDSNACWAYTHHEFEVVEEIPPGGFKVGDRVRIKHTPVGTFAPLLFGGQTGTLECYDGTDRCPWRVELDKRHNCIWVATDELEPLPQPEHDPDDVKLTSPAEPDEDDESGCTPEEVCSLPAVEILYMLRDSLQEVTFTAYGDIIAKFK